jgi:ribonuclease-3
LTKYCYSSYYFFAMHGIPQKSNKPRLNRSQLLVQIEEAIDYRFMNRRLLSEAFIHSSYTAISSRHGIPDNQRLEFFGNAVLGFLMSSWLLELFPESNEGELSRRKAALVDTATLAGLARQLDLGKYLLLSYGEEKTGGRSKKTILAAAFEALLAAVYLDGGSICAEVFLKRLYGPLIASERNGDDCRDYKTQLQELAHSLCCMPPFYILDTITGPDHNLCFSVTVMVGDECFARGTGKTRKEAEQRAAREGLVLLEEISVRKNRSLSDLG